VIDMATGESLEAESFEHHGDVALCSGGGSGGGSSTTNTVDYDYNARMASLSEEQQGWAREYYQMWQTHFKPYEIAQAQANMALLPLETESYRKQLEAINTLLPQQTKVAGQFMDAATQGVDINERMSLATADASSAWANANSATRRENARLGVNPNSGRYQGIQAALGTQQAAQLAGARTQARVGAEQENYQRLKDAASTNLVGQYLQGVGTLKEG
jgi:hypothetical protein